jgi:DNA-binding response OmpR family regulator
MAARQRFIHCTLRGTHMLSVLVVENDYLLADELDRVLTEHGFHVVGPAPNLETAQRLLADNRIDVACLDVRLSGEESSVPLAQSLAALGIPFVFLTGYPVAYLPLAMRYRPKLEKPVDLDLLVERLRALTLALAAAQPPAPVRDIPYGRYRT